MYHINFGWFAYSIYGRGSKRTNSFHNFREITLLHEIFIKALMKETFTLNDKEKKSLNA